MSYRETCEKIIAEWQKNNAEYVECRFERRNIFSLRVVDGEIKRLNRGILLGFGVRVLLKGHLYFISYTEKLDEEKKLKIDFEPVSKKWMEKVELIDTQPIKDKVIVEAKTSFNDIETEEKVRMVKEENKKILSGTIKTVDTTYSEVMLSKHIITSEGTDIYMSIPYIYISHTITASALGKLNESRVRLGGVGGLELLKPEKLDEIANLGRDNAIEGLTARRVKPGVYKVLLDGDLNHLFAHEAVGHASEADIVKEASLLKGKLGKKIATPIVDLVDDGRFEVYGMKGFGWIPYDDEGIPTKKTYIIKNGVLKTYLTNRYTAKYFKLETTGNARAQDFMNPPIVRMRNTFIVASDEKEALTNEELMEELKNGLFLRAGRGGQVDTVRGTFTFGVQEAYRVEDGEIKERLASTSISGNFLQVLSKISAVGKVFDDPAKSVGFCGKSGQAVPVGVSGVWLLVDRLQVGG